MNVNIYLINDYTNMPCREPRKNKANQIQSRQRPNNSLSFLRRQSRKGRLTAESGFFDDRGFRIKSALSEVEWVRNDKGANGGACARQSTILQNKANLREIE